MLSNRSFSGVSEATLASIAESIICVSPNESCRVPRTPSKFSMFPIWARTRSNAGPYSADRIRSMSSLGVKPQTGPAVSMYAVMKLSHFNGLPLNRGNTVFMDFLLANCSLVTVGAWPHLRSTASGSRDLHWVLSNAATDTQPDSSNKFLLRSLIGACGITCSPTAPCASLLSEYRRSTTVSSR